MNKVGIITKNGVFVSCESWKHIATAYLLDTSDQFILCKNEIGYGGEYQQLDIVGSLNKKMLDALFDFATFHKIVIEDVILADLEIELSKYRESVK